MDQESERMIRKHLVQLRREQTELKAALDDVKEQIEYWELQLGPLPKKKATPREVKHHVYGIIKRISSESSHAEMGEVISIAEQLGFNRESTLDAIMQLKQCGDIYEPNPGMFKAL